MSSVTQATRFLSLTTPLGDEALLLERFTGHEALSSLFEYTLDLLSEDAAIAFSALVGKTATIHLETEDGPRHIHGCISQFSQSGVYEGDMQHRLYRYQAVLVPWLWNLTRTTDSRIFQHKTVPDIITQIFRDLGYSDYQPQLTASYEPRPYCVQYRETDLHFVSRLMEDEGIFYFFTHAADKHTLVLCDTNSTLQPCPGRMSAPYEPQGGPQGGDAVTHWQQSQEVRSAQQTLTDYNFETPSNRLQATVATTVTVGKNPKLEAYDHPGHFLKRPAGERYAKLRMEAEEARHTLIHGASNCRVFLPGHTFQLTDHYRPDYNSTYLLTAVTHQAASNLLQDEPALYTNTFTCIPTTTPFRPQRVTPKPVVQGPQTAVVVGPPGEEIHTDQYGRIRVQFHWDREGQRNEQSSCWIRVAQSWTGKQWGTLFLPRIGHEVIVNFLDGDPDRPMITGSVYNAENMPPYALPEQQTRSGIKTTSMANGGPPMCNELRFEDKKGAEEIYVHAQKDFTRVVKHDDSLTVEHDQTIEITHNRNVQIDMGNDALTLKMGNQTTTLNLGKSTTQAMQGIELKVGANSIVLDQSGITLKGLLIKLEGALMTQIKAPMVQVNADGMLMLKGGLTMIG
jgi:type VI secretion system secreted protein VgrG